MIPFAQYVRGLDRDDDLVTVDDHADVPIDVVAAEALRASGPALRFERADGVDLVSGAFSGPDQMQRRDAQPWSRLALGLGLDPDASFVDLLETVVGLGPVGGEQEATYTGQTASQTDADVQQLQFPRGADET